MSDVFNVDIKDMVSGFEDWMTKAERGLNMFAETAAIKMAGRMRRDAKWINRTGHARQRLSSYSSRISTGWRITLAHGVWYGIFLEYAHERRYAIIHPTIEGMGANEIMPAWQRLTFQIKVK